jgi:hypothetical protein
MFVDSQHLFSNTQALTSAAASTNIVDLGAARDIGTGKPLYVCLVVDVALTDAGSNSTITVSLRGDSTSTITPDATRDLFTVPALTAAGTVFYGAIDPKVFSYRYLDVYYTMNNGDLTTGTVTAFVTSDIQNSVVYAKGYTIS